MIRFNDIIEKVSSSFSEKDIILLQKAYVFAAQAHKGQIRRSGEPYLSHPLEVSNMLADLALDPITITAGLLHDVLEDTDVTSPELHEIFGQEVAHLVEGVTKITMVGESSRETRQAEAVRKIILAMTDDLRVIFIKLADRIHNLQTLKFLPEEKQKRIAAETLDIYAPIANRLGMGRIKAELEDLSFRYVDPDNFFKIAALIDPLRKEAEEGLKKSRKKLEALMKDHQIPVKIVGRIKRPYSIYNKMENRKVRFDQVYDFLALRLLTDSVKDCYAALGIIHQSWPHLPFRFRDFIAMPKPNLYQSLHTTIITEKKHTIEIQIRTHDMHNLAENGIAAHWKYKEPLPPEVFKDDKRLQWLRDMVEMYREQKNPREFLKILKTDLIPEEVYVFTPKGKIITLPLGATALDFAFKIHTEIGLHASEAKIDGHPVPMKTILKPGNIVEILPAKDKIPSRDWLNSAFTSTARHHIKRRLKQQETTSRVALGKKLWAKELAKYHLPAAKLKDVELISRLSGSVPFRIKKIEDFYSLISIGKILLTKKLMEKLFPEEALRAKKPPLLKKVVTKVKKKSPDGIQVKEMEGSRIHLAKCCSPIKGEPIVGYITSGKGITIHARRCRKISREILASQRMVAASWDPAIKGNYHTTLIIESSDSPGVLANLTSVIAQLKGNISRALVTTDAAGIGRVKLSLEIRDIRHLDNIIKKISEIKEIRSVERT